MPILARALLLLMFVVVIVGGLVFGVASRRVRRTHDIPLPPISRATAPDEIARGGRLFRTTCLDCHAGPVADGEVGERRPIGGQVMGAPSFMGQIWAPNLTSDAETGIGSWTDGELARLLRNGLRRDGTYAATMPRFARLADADVAALIGFLRSSDPMVAPARNQVPRPGMDVAGTLALAFAAGVDTRGAPHISMPARGRSAEYGGYLAAAVYGCVDCHTEGFVPTEEKLRSPLLLAGGQFHRNPRGEPIYSINLTPDAETGLGKTGRMTTAEELARALTTGMRDDGLPIRPPMPIFRYLDGDEAAAMFAYLRSLPPVFRRTPGAARPPAFASAGASASTATTAGSSAPTPANAAPASAAQLFVSLGCAICHGEGARHRALLKRAALRPVAEIAAAILHPERQRPHSQMPTYAATVDEATATRLAEWLKSSAGNSRP